MKFIKSVFRSIGIALAGAGLVLGFLVYWLIYSVISYFVFFGISLLSTSLLEEESNEYITSVVEFLFVGEYSDIVEVLFIVGLGLIIAISKVVDKD